jgi:hypothetical protein
MVTLLHVSVQNCIKMWKWILFNNVNPDWAIGVTVQLDISCTEKREQVTA